MQADRAHIDTAGVMRCCLESLGDYMHDDPEREVNPGDRVPCKYHEAENSGFELTSDGRWRPIWVVARLKGGQNVG